MAERLIRIGRVSSVNAARGMISVTYPDLDGSTTGEFPVFSFTDEYKMPSVGSEVLVLHLSNGQSAGIVLGRYWNASNQPPVSSGFRKEMGDAFGESYLQYSGGTLTIHADKIVIDGDTEISGAADISGKVETGGAISVPASADVTVGAISLKNHLHTDSVGGKTQKPE